MDNKSSENRAPWPLYSQSFYYSFALDINDLGAYSFIFKGLLRKDIKDFPSSLISRANE